MVHLCWQLISGLFPDLKRVLSRLSTSIRTIFKMTDDDDDDDHNSTAIGITFGCVGGAVVLALFLIWLFWRYKKKVKIVFPGPFNNKHKELLTNFTLKLPGIDFVECSETEIDPTTPLVVLCMCSTRVEDACNIAMERIREDRKVVLVVFYKLVGSTTWEDVQMIIYQHKGAYKTFHIGYDHDNGVWISENDVNGLRSI